MARLILSTRNIVSGGPSIIRKPGAYRSNLELTNSLRNSFFAAREDYGTTAGSNDLGEHVEFTGRPQPPQWTARDGDVLFVPRIDWESAGLREEPSQYEITMKMFFLSTSPVAHRARYAKEALDLVLKELKVSSIDLLIVSFPGMSLEGDCEWEAELLNAGQGDNDDEHETWKAIEQLYRQERVRRVGVAEFGSGKLARFLQRATVKPTVDQINIKNCCDVPPPLVQLAKEEKIELLVHTDCTDILPKGTLRELLGQGVGGAGILADSENGKGGLQGDLSPRWVAKYTAVVKDRGVIENKGYFASAELVEL